MPRDDFARRLRTALDAQPTAAVTPDVSASTPLQQLRHLATYGESESVRLQAARFLLDRQEADRARRERARDAGADDPVAALLAPLTDGELDREWDHMCGRDIVEAALRGDDGAFPQLAAAVRAAVEVRGRELADRDAIDREIAERVEERAHVLADDMYRRRAFATVGAPAPRDTDESAPVPVTVSETADGPDTAAVAEPPPGLTWEDLRRGWFRPSASGVRRPPRERA
jgi:hypothetical protein